MVDKDENNKQIVDDDILQCKEDILRARDIMPPFKKKTDKERKSQKTEEKTNPPADIVEISSQKGKTTRDDIKPTARETTKRKEPPLPEQKQVDIPKFDLAEEIMAEQRKITAVRRKGPGKKAETEEVQLQSDLAGYSINQPTALTLEEDKIIAEIVARDIERLCRGDSSDSGR